MISEAELHKQHRLSTPTPLSKSIFSRETRKRCHLNKKLALRSSSIVTNKFSARYFQMCSNNKMISLLNWLPIHHNRIPTILTLNNVPGAKNLFHHPQTLLHNFTIKDGLLLNDVMMNPLNPESIFFLGDNPRHFNKSSPVPRYHITHIQTSTRFRKTHRIPRNWSLIRLLDPPTP